MTEQGFRVGLAINGDQSYMPPPFPNPPVYVVVAFNTIVETDTTGGFDVETFSWTAPADGVLITGFQVWNQAGVGYGEGAVSKLSKNQSGHLDTAGIGAPGMYPNTSPQAGSMRYRVVAGDVFKIINYCTALNQARDTPIVINSRHEHTWWWGSFTADPS